MPVTFWVEKLRSGKLANIVFVLGIRNIGLGCLTDWIFWPTSRPALVIVCFHSRVPLCFKLVNLLRVNRRKTPWIFNCNKNQTLVGCSCDLGRPWSHMFQRLHPPVRGFLGKNDNHDDYYSILHRIHRNDGLLFGEIYLYAAVKPTKRSASPSNRFCALIPRKSSLQRLLWSRIIEWRCYAAKYRGV